MHECQVKGELTKTKFNYIPELNIKDRIIEVYLAKVLSNKDVSENFKNYVRDHQDIIKITTNDERLVIVKVKDITAEVGIEYKTQLFRKYVNIPSSLNQGEYSIKEHEYSDSCVVVKTKDGQSFNTDIRTDSSSHSGYTSSKVNLWGDHIIDKFGSRIYPNLESKNNWKEVSYKPVKATKNNIGFNPNIEKNIYGQQMFYEAFYKDRKQYYDVVKELEIRNYYEIRDVELKLYNFQSYTIRVNYENKDYEVSGIIPEHLEEMTIEAGVNAEACKKLVKLNTTLSVVKIFSMSIPILLILGNIAMLILSIMNNGAENLDVNFYLFGKNLGVEPCIFLGGMVNLLLIFLFWSLTDYGIRSASVIARLVFAIILLVAVTLILWVPMIRCHVEFYRGIF